jgi:hypothetical protein
VARRPRRRRAIFALAWLAGCGGAPASGPAGECARVVRIYKDLETVGVVGSPRETSEGRVEIAYEGMDMINAPAKGAAACSFAVGKAGKLWLISAVVDGEPLDAPAIDAIRGELAGSAAP